jgi:hypothetical protein
MDCLPAPLTPNLVNLLTPNQLLTLTPNRAASSFMDCGLCRDRRQNAVVIAALNVGIPVALLLMQRNATAHRPLPHRQHRGGGITYHTYHRILLSTIALTYLIYL